MEEWKKNIGGHVKKWCLKDGNQSGKCVSELHYRVTPLEPWTFLNNDKGHICKKHGQIILKVVINRTDTCYNSKNQNCFVSWKIFKNAYSNFDDGVFSQKEPYCNQYLNSSTSEKFLHFRQEKRVKLLCFFFNFVILDYPYKNMLLPITSHQQRSRRFLFFLYARPGTGCWKHG